MGAKLMIDFTFDEERHLYIVPGREVLATGDVLALNGLCDYSQIPSAILEGARWRGTQVDNAIRFYEEDDLEFDRDGNPSIPDDILPYFRAYLKFKLDTGFQVTPPCQLAIVYESVGEQLIGCHLDLVGTINGRLHIVDIKATHPNSGKAKKQTHFRWGMQLTSYYKAYGDEEANRIVVHTRKDGDYELVEYDDLFDVDTWESLVRVATAKLANGYKRPEK
jgi:hypothetical protein